MHVSTEVAGVPAHSSLRIEGTKLTLQEEQKNLNTVVERCLAKMEVDSRERPFLDACLEGVKPMCVCLCVGCNSLPFQHPSLPRISWKLRDSEFSTYYVHEDVNFFIELMDDSLMIPEGKSFALTVWIH